MAEKPKPETVRQDFVRLLESARRKLGSAGGDSSIRALAREMKVSPSRAADWTRGGFYLDIKERDSDARLRKAVAGFTSSLDRAMAWLTLNGFAKEVDTLLNLEDILAGYWPEERRGILSSPIVASGISDGRSDLDPHPSGARMRIEVRIVSWDAFTHWDSDAGQARPAVRTGFFWSYADAILKSIDPLDSDIVPIPASFAEALELPPPVEPYAKVLSLGLYDTLHREFRGGEFVGIPLFRVPLVGLEIRKEGHWPTTELDFEASFGREPDCDPYVIEHEVGHIFLASIARDPDRITRIAAYKDLRIVAEELREAALEHADGVPITFLGDGTIALGIYARLKASRGISVRVIAQRFEHELSYSIGFMVRNDDQVFLRLLRAAQEVVLRTPWRVIGLLGRLLDGIDSWAQSLMVRDALTDWPETAKIFLFDPADLVRAGLPEEPAKRLARHIRKWVADNSMNSGALNKLWKEVVWEENAP